MTQPRIPKASWPIFGHTAIVGYLQRAAQTRQTVQAYLLHGPDQLGKTTLARLFARALLCTGSARQPCEKCPACLNSAHGTHPDFIELAKDPDQQNIGIDQVRDQIVKRLQLSSFLNTYKIALISGAQYLSQESANALLKTLEEPRKKVVVILVADEMDVLPATVVSRCQSFELFPLSSLDIEAYIKLLQPDIKHALLRTVASLARGRPGRAWQLLMQPAELEQTLDEQRTWREILSAPAWQRFKLLGDQLSGASFQENRVQAELMIHGLMLVLRDEMLVQHNLPGYTIGPSDPMAVAARPVSLRAPRLIRSLIASRRALAQNASPRLLLEQFCLEF